MWVAFWELSTCRAYGMAVGPIPWTAIDAYARRHDIAGEDYDDLVYFVRAMDGEYLERQNKK